MSGDPEGPIIVDVVILTWNDGALLQRAVDSVAASVGVLASCIVVDNGSQPPAIVGSGARLIRNETNRGVALARNQGVTASSAPFVCFLDSDAALLPDTLAQLVGPMCADCRIGLTAPVFRGQNPAQSAGIAPTWSRKLARGLGLTSRYATGGTGGAWRNIDFAIGACQLFRRSVFEEVGGLDETYFYGPEDVDFCLRVKAVGHRIVQVVRAGCDHPPRRRNRSLLTRRGLRHGWAVARHLWRHRGGR